MKHRKISLTIVLLMIFSLWLQVALAVPASPVIHTLEQKDGSKFMAKLWGDEWSHGWETTDNYSIIFDENTKEWTYAITGADGNLLPSTKVVGRDSPPDNIPKHLRPTEKAQSKILNLRASKAPALPNRVVPSSGTANIPVLLINFNDTTTTYTAANFTTLLFGNGVKSMKDYYEEVSYGIFSVSPGPGGVAGWFTASKNHDYYGQNDSLGNDMWPGTLVREAVAAADASFDFAPYDQNSDCYVDVVNIIHQGSGEEAGGPSTDIWSHSWDLNSAYHWGNSDGGEYTTDDPCSKGGYIKVNDYVIQPETLWGGQQTMGVFAHEYGHALGLPDLYDTNSSNGESEGIGVWGLMGSGSWLGDPSGSSPAHLSAWSKYFLGWVNPIKITSTLLNEQISQAETDDDVYMILDNPGDTPGNLDWSWSGTGNGEYFLVENRNKTGYDAYLPGDGLLIWHIDESRGNNDDETHKLVDLEEADGLNDLDNEINRGDANDPWYNKIIGFTEATTPNSHLYNGSASGVRVSNISASASIMTANLIVSWPPPIITFVSPTPANNSILSRNWVYVNITSDESLNAALLEWNGTNETMLGSGINWYKNMTGLEEGVYTYRVWANDSSGNFNVSETRYVRIDFPPSITFVFPTPANNSNLSQNWVYVNITSNEMLNTALLEWNGINETTIGSGINWYKNKTYISDGNHSYRVWGNDSANNPYRHDSLGLYKNAIK